RCFGRALRELPHFVGDDGEAQSGLAGARRLDRGVQREEVGLRGDAFDRVDDVRDLERAVTEALDLFGDCLDLAADALHPFEAVSHCAVAFLGSLERLASRTGGPVRAVGDLPDGTSPVTDGPAPARRL